METSKMLLSVCVCFLGLCIVLSMSTDPLTLSVEDLKAIYEKIGWEADWTQRELREGYGVAVAVHRRLEEASFNKEKQKTYWTLSRRGNGLNCLRAMHFLHRLKYNIEGILLPSRSASPNAFPNVLASVKEAGKGIAIVEPTTADEVLNGLPKEGNIRDYAAYFECIGGTGEMRSKVESKAQHVLNLFKKLEDTKYKEIQTFAIDVPFFWNEKYGINVSDTDTNQNEMLYTPNQIIAVGKFKEYQSDPKYSEILHTLVELDTVNDTIAAKTVALETSRSTQLKAPSFYKLFIATAGKMTQNNPDLMWRSLENERWTEEKLLKAPLF